MKLILILVLTTDCHFVIVNVASMGAGLPKTRLCRKLVSYCRLDIISAIYRLAFAVRASTAIGNDESHKGIKTTKFPLFF